MENEKRLKLFGVDIYAAMAEDENETIRKSKSLGDLQSCDGNKNQSGYSSDGALIEKSKRRTRDEKKRGVPWSEEEHRNFLIGLEQLGKGDWKGISRNFVPTRTPTQVASHAQKYFLRQNNRNKRRRRSSLFDVGIKDNAAQSEFPTEVLSEEIDAVTKRTNMGNPPPMFASQTKPPKLEAPPKSYFLGNYNCTQSTHGLMGTDLMCNPKFLGSANYPNFLQLSLGN